jgi:hypothetical protein
MAVGGAISEIAPAYAVICGAGAIGTLSVLGVLRSVQGRGASAGRRPLIKLLR